MKLGSNVGVLRVGSTAVAAIKRGTDRVYDADVAAFQKVSDAADVTGIMDLVDYLKGQSLWDYARFYPMKSSQNAGSGSTVYGLGGLTSNNMTLVNSPTWGSGGVTFNAPSSQHGNIGPLSGGGDLYVSLGIDRSTATPASAEALFGQYSFSTAQRALIFYQRGDIAGDPFTVQRSANGSAVQTVASTDELQRAGPQVLTAVCAEGSLTEIYQDKTTLTLDTSVATVTGILDSSQPYMVAASNNNGTAESHYNGRMFCVLVIVGESTTPTTTQRETITDLINAL